MQPSDTNYHLPPFPAFPSSSRYVPLGSVQEAFVRVCRSIDASEAISLVIGPPGTGKSLLSGLIAHNYRKSHDVVVLGETRLDDRNAFLRHLLHHLQIEISRIPDGDLQLALIDHVYSDESAEGGLLIVVDEAQSLSAEVLEAIRMVTNIMRHGVPRVSAVVCGGVKLDDLLVEASMEAFTQRVATRCYLHPLNGEETKQYIRETIRQCGADPNGTINDAAIATIHHACSGVPRLINQLMTQAIDCAEEADQAMITERIIDIAWSQLQQLPSPMVEEPRIRHESTNVEFGDLDDSDAFMAAPEFKQTAQTKSISSEDLPSLDDIVVEGSSELWFDEQALELEPVRTRVNRNTTETIEDLPTDQSLFGDFDIEEEIAIGTGFTRKSSQGSEAPVDLERALHSELVGLNACLADLLNQPIDVDFPVDASESLDDESFEINQPEEVVEDFVTVAEDETQSQETQPQTAETKQQAIPFEPHRIPEEDAPEEAAQHDVAQPVDSIFWISAGEAAADENADRLTHDDSDLLVIEDEVEVRRIDAAKQYDSLDQTISVDFQAMLSRMRTGAKS